MNIRDLILIDQPTGAPTRKIAAAGIAGVIVAPAVVGLILTVLPDLSRACAEELGFVLTGVGSALFAGALAFLTGYKTRNRATDAGT